MDRVIWYLCWLEVPDTSGVVEVCKSWHKNHHHKRENVPHGWVTGTVVEGYKNNLTG